MPLQKIDKLQSTLHMTDLGAAQSTHTVFVDDAAQARHFDVAAAFDCPRELVANRANRLRTSQLRQKRVVGADTKEEVMVGCLKRWEMPDSLQSLDRQRRKSYKELQLRLDRLAQLELVRAKLEAKEQLGKRDPTHATVVKKETKDSAPVVRFEYVRRR